MAVSVACNSITMNVNGARFINFADGNQLEFASLEALTDFATSVDAQDQADTAHRMLLRHWLAMNPEGDNLSFIVGKRLTFDLSQAQAITVEDI